MKPEPAKQFYDAFCDRVRREYVADKVEGGKFGAWMEVSIVRHDREVLIVVVHLQLMLRLVAMMQVNDGPVTMQIDSKVRKPAKS